MNDRAFRDQVRHLHACGPRPLGELLSEILANTCPQCRDLTQERLERYAEMDPKVLRWLGADDWLEPAAVIRLVLRGRP